MPLQPGEKLCPYEIVTPIGRRHGGLSRRRGGIIGGMSNLGRIAICGLILLVPSGRLGAQSAPIQIRVDATKAPQKLIHASMTMPAEQGPLTLMYPQWIPGDHQPVGPISDLVGVKIRANGTPLAWSRDMVDMYAFHVDVPAGARSLDIDLDLILAPEAIGTDSSSSSTPQLMVFYWSSVLLYPKGKHTDEIDYRAELRIPDGWSYGTALPVEWESDGAIRFKTCSLTTLADSPVLAGRYLKTIDLGTAGSGVPQMIHIAGDSPAAIDATPELTESWKKLVKEAAAVFGPGHFRDYHFLFSMSDHMQPFAGLEHHESSDNRLLERGIRDEGARRYSGDLLAHEMTHSWNGKFRRPTGLATKDFSVPMKGDLLWVYEGLTQYYGQVLAARSGLFTAEDFRENTAREAARLSAQTGRTWRALEDTAVAVQTTYSARDDYSDYRRGAEYYPESALIWLEADVVIRQMSNGARSLDDFCRIFTGGQAGTPSVKPYDFDEVVATLNRVQTYDWAAFLTERVRKIAPKAPLAGIEGAGWKVTFTDHKSDFQKFAEEYGKRNDFSDSIGFSVKEDGTVVDVRTTSEAYAAGIAPSVKLIAVNGR
jgi:predicted metalloprotease with PDZ domain